MRQQLLMGNEALAYAAVAAGVNVVCGYPGTPSTEIVETVARINPGSIHVEWSTNEKAALELAAGASYSGARTLVTMKQVGMNVASDPFMSLVYVGVQGGLVVVVADDPGPISSQTEQDTRQFAQFAHVPCFDPSSPEQAYEMMREAFEVSERLKIPVILRPTTRINHGCATCEIDNELRSTPHHITGFVKDPRFVIFPRRSYQGHLEIIQKLEELSDEFSASSFNVRSEFHLSSTPNCESPERALYHTNKDVPPRRVGIVAGGVSIPYVHESLEILRHALSQEVCGSENNPGDGEAGFIGTSAKDNVISAGNAVLSGEILEIGTPHPAPEQLIVQFLADKTDVIVFEELEPVLERICTEIAGRHGLKVQISGKLNHATALAGENSPELIARQLADYMGLHDLYAPYDTKLNQSRKISVELPVRPPTLCAGCPHRSSFLAVKDVSRSLIERGLADEAVYAGDIGCYTLGNAAPLDMTDTCLCMGAGITVAQGLQVAAKAHNTRQLSYAFIGDSTFFASGMTGVANAVYNNHNICLIVLDNATTAMTGSQPHPGTGQTLMSEVRPPIPLAPVLEALGVSCVITADPLDVTAAQRAVEEASLSEGVSAVVFESPCISLMKKPPAASVEMVRCVGCESCITSTGCPALVNDEGITRIDADLCYGCNLCVHYCPVQAITLSERPLQSREVLS